MYFSFAADHDYHSKERTLLEVIRYCKDNPSTSLEVGLDPELSENDREDIKNRIIRHANRNGVFLTFS